MNIDSEYIDQRLNYVFDSNIYKLSQATYGEGYEGKVNMELGLNKLINIDTSKGDEPIIEMDMTDDGGLVAVLDADELNENGEDANDGWNKLVDEE